MESSNSGSFQSSSGGGGGGGGGDNEVEYDSRSQSISSFFSPSTNFNPTHHHQPHPPPPSSYHRPSPADHNAFYNITNNNNNPSSAQVQDPGSVWTGTIRPEQMNLALADLMNPSSSSTTTLEKAASRGSYDHQIGVTTKNPKKRTRASRRAPTTVLTTDTTNFRQMVQEFTGIPTAPFSRRLDLFSTSLRPKIQPFLNNNSTSTTTAANNNNIIVESGNNYQFAPSSTINNNFQKQPPPSSTSSFLDLPNPMAAFSFQSLLAVPPPPPPPQHHDLSSALQQQQQQQKRWGGDHQLQNINGKLESSNFIGNTTTQNVATATSSKFGSGILENHHHHHVLAAAASSRSGTSGGATDQLQGNNIEASWICPSS